MGADRVLGRAGRLAQLVLVGERQLRDFVQATRRRGAGEARGRELGAVERRALEQVLELGAVVRVVSR